MGTIPSRYDLSFRRAAECAKWGTDGRKYRPASSIVRSAAESGRVSADLRLEPPNAGSLAPDDVLTRQEVAAWLKVRPRQLERLGVPACHLGHRTVRYLRPAVQAWLETKQRGLDNGGRR